MHRPADISGIVAGHQQRQQKINHRYPYHPEVALISKPCAFLHGLIHHNLPARGLVCDKADLGIDSLHIGREISMVIACQLFQIFFRSDMASDQRLIRTANDPPCLIHQKYLLVFLPCSVLEQPGKLLLLDAHVHQSDMPAAV